MRNPKLTSSKGLIRAKVHDLARSKCCCQHPENPGSNRPVTLHYEPPLSRFHNYPISLKQWIDLFEVDNPPQWPHLSPHMVSLSRLDGLQRLGSLSCNRLLVRSVSSSDVEPLMDFKGLTWPVTGPVTGLCMYMLITLVTRGDGIRGKVSWWWIRQGSIR